MAKGKFEGAVLFWDASIEKIEDLSCGKNNDGIRLDIKNCPNLQSVPLTFNPREIKAEPKIIGKLKADRLAQKQRAKIVEINPQS